MEKNIQNHSDIKETIIDATISLIESFGRLDREYHDARHRPKG